MLFYTSVIPVSNNGISEKISYVAGIKLNYGVSKYTLPYTLTTTSIVGKVHYLPLA